MQELYKQIKKDAALIFFEENNFGFKGSFGVEKEEMGHLMYIADPYNQYKKFSLKYFLFPKSFKQIVSDPNKYNQEHNHKILEIFHYQLRPKTTNRIIMEMAETKKTISRGKVSKIDYFEKNKKIFYEKFGEDAACIRINLYGFLDIIAKRELTQKTTNFMKEKEENMFKILENTLEKKTYERIMNIERTKNIEEIIIYDMVNLPKIIRHKRII